MKNGYIDVTRLLAGIITALFAVSCGSSDSNQFANPSLVISNDTKTASSTSNDAIGATSQFKGPGGGMEGWLTAPNGNKIYTRVLIPSSASFIQAPALIAIPGGSGSGARIVSLKLYQGLADAGFVVVGFNPEGKGSGYPGDLLSEGADDCSGYTHQDDLKAVIEYIASQSYVDSTSIGIITSSFGLLIGAGAVGRYPDLPVDYLIDVEGPHDNRVITFYDVGKETEVCGHLSAVTDPSKSNVAFWMEREPIRYIGGFRGRYMRIQSEIDHAQGEGYFRHAIEMVNAATRPEYGGSGASEWTRMNGDDTGNDVNGVYLLDDMATYPLWVSGLLFQHPDLIKEYVFQMSRRWKSQASG